MDKSKNYFSPSGEAVSVYVDGTWTLFARHDSVSELFKEMIQKEAVAFAHFLDDGHWRKNKKSNLWFNNNFEFLEEEQLYNKFIEQKQSGI